MITRRFGRAGDVELGRDLVLRVCSNEQLGSRDEISF